MEGFEGFDIPKQNWSKLPHQLIDKISEINSLAELKIILYILRHTWGFQEYGITKRITLDEFRNGRKRKDGSRIDNGVGMSVNAIKDGIKRAVDDGFIIREKDNRDKGRRSHKYIIKTKKVSKVDSRVSRVDSQPNIIDSRTEKDTLRKKTKINTSRNKLPRSEKPKNEELKNGNELDEEEAEVMEWLAQKDKEKPPQKKRRKLTAEEHTERTKRAWVRGMKRNAGKPNLPWLPDDKRVLGEAFIEATGKSLMPLKSERTAWHKFLGDWVELGMTPAIIKKAVNHMKDERLTIGGPQSITKIARSLMAEAENPSKRRTPKYKAKDFKDR